MKIFLMSALFAMIPMAAYAAPNWETGLFTVKSINVQANSSSTVLFNVNETASTFAIQVGQMGVDWNELQLFVSVLMTAQATGAKISIRCEQSGTKYVEIVSITGP